MQTSFSFKQTSFIYDISTRRICFNSSTSLWTQLTSTYESFTATIDGQTYSFLLEDALSVHASSFKDGVSSGIETLFSGYQVHGHFLNLSFKTRIYLDNYLGDLHFEIYPLAEEGINITKLFWPAPFEFSNLEPTHYTVLPVMQGYVIPNTYDKEIDIPWDKVYYERAAYMPWWGQIKDSSGFIAIATTPWDGGYDFNHPAGGPTTVRPYWRPSLGKLNYPRKLIYKFLENCDYNTLCKVYRTYIKEKGQLVTLKEKIARNPKVEQLIGSSIVHTGGWYHAVEDCQLYNSEELEKNDEFITFSEIATHIKALKALNIPSIYLHLDGWGKRGYDNLHPDIWPPADRLGGLDGLQSLIDTCHECGYLLGIHDQYRDYYYDAETFSFDNALHHQNLETPFCDIWHGGKHTFICPSVAIDYVKRNYEFFHDAHVTLDGSYLDVFSVVELDECFHNGHMLTRKECIEKRGECFNYIRSQNLIVSSEEVVDWTIPYLDLCHHAPFRVNPDNVPYAPVAPLFSLVYHDCIVVPWSSKDGDWYIPTGDHPTLYALLYGGISYLPLTPTKLDINNALCVGKLHSQIAHCELTKHEFLNSDRRKQKTYFSDGTTVEVDFNQSSFIISINNQILTGSVK